jgi:hypothetical protein
LVAVTTRGSSSDGYFKSGHPPKSKWVAKGKNPPWILHEIGPQTPLDESQILSQLALRLDIPLSVGRI